MLGVKDIMARYQLKSRQTAAKRMKQMHTQLNVKPYMVPESAVIAWEKSREVHPPELVRTVMRAQRRRARRGGQ